MSWRGQPNFRVFGRVLLSCKSSEQGVHHRNSPIEYGPSFGKMLYTIRQRAPRSRRGVGLGPASMSLIQVCFTDGDVPAKM
eukprot:5590883-Amphidinium_carterae.1